MADQRGRPRGPNYEKNLAKRQAAERRQAEQRAEGKISYLAKALLSQINTQRFAGQYGQKAPVYSYSESQWLHDGVLLRPADRVSFRDLRAISLSNSLIGAIHTVRVDDLSQFAHPYDGECGFDLDMEDMEKQAKGSDKKLIKEAREFFKFMGDKVEGWSARDHYNAVFQFMIRDTLALDRTTFYLDRSRRGPLREIRYLDPATIYQVGQQGFKGNKNVGSVQIINNEYVEEFGHDQILLRHKNRISDVRYRMFGISPAEVSVMEIIAVINALKYNRQRFSNNPPPGFFSVQGSVSEEVLNALQLQWEDMWTNNENNFRFPMMSSEHEVKYTPLNIHSDIAFEKLMQWLSTFVLACHGMDQAELGLRLMGSSSLSEGSMDGRMQSSMTRAKRALLAYFASIYNDLIEIDTRYKGLVFVFRGIDPEDEDKTIERQSKLVKSTQTVDEIRAQQDLPTLGEEFKKRYNLSDEEFEKVKFAGAVIEDPTWSQLAGGMIGQLSNPQEPEGAPDEVDDDFFDDSLLLDDETEEEPSEEDDTAA